MLSTLIYFALLQVACALSIEQRSDSSNHPARSARLQSRSLTKNEKVAIGICVPGAALVVGMGIVVMMMYPAQTRKLRRANPGAHVGFAEVMAGRVTHTAPPKYTEHDESVDNLPLQDLNADGRPTPRPEPRATLQTPVPAQQAPVDARHAALSLG
ncbi:hypothetical protein CC86DRAFT_368520 [Ophiobolus disseminans]|uniref:Mid2 domain-containing protein n=1 Tax=Ophiobolus disseminans TaxID=1469910 RepID=A0A6A7A8A9_9PLEO|nr:hypothetical protein CC86DRAFT_368520 [Ophiobolus disseminans]